MRRKIRKVSPVIRPPPSAPPKIPVTSAMISHATQRPPTTTTDGRRPSTVAASERLAELAALARYGYRIGRKIGKGTYATVTIAQFTDTATGLAIPLACKIVQRSKAPDDFVRRFFPRELDILAKIECPHIIQLHSILERHTKIYIFMRFAENGDLLAHVQQHGSTAEPLARLWFGQLAKALEYLHGQNIAHRDLKCENVLLSHNMNAKLADFGFARYCTRDADGQRALSETYCGSGSYAAPEVVAGRPYDPLLADLWSLGVILFIVVDSSMPFDDSNLARMLSDQRQRHYRFSDKVLASITYAVRDVVDALLEPDCKLRWSLSRVLGCRWLRNDDGLSSLDERPDQVAGVSGAGEVVTL